jgi:hypothetical protein
MADLIEAYHEHFDRDPPDLPGPGAASAKAGKEAIRGSVVDLARTFVRAGHYLEGTAGNTPNLPDGNPGGGKRQACNMLPPCLNPDLKETMKGHVLSVCSAWTQVKGYNTCAGRSGIFVQPPANALLPYLEDAKTIQSMGIGHWPGVGAFQLHPRRYFLGDKLQENGKIVWGESCVGRRHFDCVGLVNFCYEEHTKRVGGWAFEISQYMSGLAGTSPVAVKRDLSNVMNGDVVCRLKPHEHIGLLYRNKGDVFVIQATETSVGLTDDTLYVPDHWSKCVRVQDGYLLPRKHLLKDGNGH